MKWLIAILIIVAVLIFYSNKCEGFGRSGSRGGGFGRGKSRSSGSGRSKSPSSGFPLVGLGRSNKKNNCSFDDCNIHCLGRKDVVTCRNRCIGTTNCKNII